MRRLPLSLALLALAFSACTSSLPRTVDRAGQADFRFHPADKDNKYSYFYYVPRSLAAGKPVRILFMGHSSPKIDTYAGMEDYVRKNEVPFLKNACDAFGYAGLIVVTPRLFGSMPDIRMNTQSMARWVMFSNDFDKPSYEFYKRPDLEFVKAIDDVKRRLETLGLHPEEKVFMFGFSNGGLQANRFSILHPDKVAAVAISSAGAFLYPTNALKQRELPYPIGTADIGQIPGSSFDLEAFKKIAHLITVGENDTARANDPVAFDDNFDRAEAQWINGNLGATAVERAKHFEKYLRSAGVPASLKVYPKLGHDYSAETLQDMWSFFLRASR